MVKTFNDFINGVKINESIQDPSEHLDAVINALPELEKLVFKYNKFKVNLKAKIELTRSGSIIKIYSDDLTKDLSPLGKTMFSKIAVGFWGGNVTQDGKTIWFNPKVWYEHPSGGSNGTSFIWDSLWFDLETNKWIEGRRF